MPPFDSPEQRCPDSAVSVARRRKPAHLGWACSVIASMKSNLTQASSDTALTETESSQSDLRSSFPPYHGPRIFRRGIVVNGSAGGLLNGQSKDSFAQGKGQSGIDFENGKRVRRLEIVAMIGAAGTSRSPARRNPDRNRRRSNPRSLAICRCLAALSGRG